jgi:hypothetical protein
MASMYSATINSSIPTGSWTLYFHSPAEEKWSLSTFTKVGTIVNWNDFWNIISELNSELFCDGMFFLMRDPHLPLWENSKNVYGGCYSFRAVRNSASDTFINCMITSMLNAIYVDPKNTVNGLSISPKKDFNVIKIWNTDSVNYNKPSDVNNELCQNIIYTPFIQKRM